MRRILVATGAVAALAALGPSALATESIVRCQYSGPQQMLGGTTSDESSIAKRLMYSKRYAEAVPHLQSALADNPRDVEIINFLALAKRMMGDYEASGAYSKRTLSIRPNNKAAHENLGELYLLTHDQASAQAELDTLASLCPSGCDERDALAKAIAAYVPQAPAAGSAAPATPAAPSAPKQ